MSDERKDPTRPLDERTPEELSAFIDDHLIMALEASDVLHAVPSVGTRDTSEDYLRDRLVYVSDSWQAADALAHERRRRTSARLRALIMPIDDTEPTEGD